MENPQRQLNSKNNKIKASIIGVVFLVVFVSWSNVLDNISNNYADKALVQSTIAFGAARGMNAAISVIQSTTLEFQLVGGISVAIGEVLDPLNDLVEDYSELMKLSIGSLVIQKLLIEITGSSLFKLALTVSAILLILSVFIKDNIYINTTFKIFIFLLFIRFSIAIALLMNGFVDGTFIHHKVEDNLAVVEGATKEIESVAISDNDSSQVMDQILNKLKALNSEKKQLQESISINNKNISDLRNKISAANQKRDELSGKLSMPERLNVFQKDESIKELDDLIESEKLNLDQFLNIQNKLKDELSEIKSDIEEFESELNAPSPSVINKFNKMKEQLSSYANNLNITKLKKSLERSIANILNMMALFVFRTLILPLLFLVLLIKGTNLIWDIDLKKHINIKALNRI